MIKILYAASNSVGAKIRLHRFLQAIKGKNYHLKIAAYIKSSPAVSIDWTLDALYRLNVNSFNFDNDNFRVFYNQVKSFNPDLVISDIEVFSSYIADLLNIKCWQVSPLFLHDSASEYVKYKVKLEIKYPHLYHHLYNEILEALIGHADKKLVYSYFGDVNQWELSKGYEWVRPYYIEGKDSKIAKHDIVSISPNANSKLVEFSQRYKDSVFFLDKHTKLDKLLNKSLYDQNEYASNLRNAKYFFNEGYGNFMADAFYNKQYAFTIPNYNDPECVMEALYSKHFKYGNLMFLSESVFNKYKFDFKLNDNVKFLHEKIDEEFEC